MFVVLGTGCGPPSAGMPAKVVWTEENGNCGASFTVDGSGNETWNGGCESSGTSQAKALTPGQRERLIRALDQLRSRWNEGTDVERHCNPSVAVHLVERSGRERWWVACRRIAQEGTPSDPIPEELDLLRAIR